MADSPRQKPKTFKALKQRSAHEATMADAFIIHSLQALAAGTASEHQQKSALTWIISQACATHAPAYYDTDRESVFMMGRQFPGQQIIGLLKVDMISFNRTKETTNE